MNPFRKNKIDLQKSNKTILRYNTKFMDGLTDEQILERKKNGLTNVSIDGSFKSVKKIIFENTFTYFNFIFIVLAILLCSVQSYHNLTFLPIVIINTLIGIV